jgi:hypothetical protein
MFIDLGNRVTLTEEQFQAEMRARIAANPGKDFFPGCPLCSVVAKLPPGMNAAPTQNQNQNQNQQGQQQQQQNQQQQ